MNIKQIQEKTNKDILAVFYSGSLISQLKTEASDTDYIVITKSSLYEEYKGKTLGTRISFENEDYRLLSLLQFINLALNKSFELVEALIANFQENHPLYNSAYIKDENTREILSELYNTIITFYDNHKSYKHLLVKSLLGAFNSNYKKLYSEYSNFPLEKHPKTQARALRIMFQINYILENKKFNETDLLIVDNKIIDKLKEVRNSKEFSKIDLDVRQTLYLFNQKMLQTTIKDNLEEFIQFSADREEVFNKFIAKVVSK